jgi:hypothetical protein
MIPDMSTVVDALMDDLEIIFKENMTALLQDYSTLRDNIDTETKTINEVQHALDQARTIGKIDDFDILHIDLQNIHEPTEATKIAFWGATTGLIIASLALLWCCCPACVTEAIKYTFTLAWETLAFFFTRFRNAIIDTCGRRQSTPPPPDSESIDAVLWSNDCIEIPFRGPSPRPLPQPLLSTLNEQTNKRPTTSRHFTPGAPDIEMSDLPRNNQHMSNSNIYPTLSKSTPLPSPVSDTKSWPWSIIKDENRLMIRCYRDGISITYLPHLNMSYNDYGMMVVIQTPKLTIIQDYMQQYVQQPSVTLKDFQELHGPHWMYNNHLRSFYAISGDTQIHKYGFKLNQTTALAV